jgi:hypothetical protein
MKINNASFKAKKNNTPILFILLSINLSNFVNKINCISNYDDVNNANYPLLLLISFGGLKPDMIDKYANITANLNHLKLISSYGYIKSSTASTKAYAYDWSMVTGKYEESYDIAAGERLINSKLIEWFIGKNKLAEPIWYLNEKSYPAKRKSASTNWIGSNIVYNDTKILNISTYKSTDNLIDIYLNMFKNKTINFGAIYIQNTRDVEKIEENIKKFDHLIGYVMTQLKLLKLFDKLNIIITSDLSHVHRLDSNRIIYLDRYVDVSQLDSMIGSSTLVNLFLNKNSNQNIFYENLTKIEQIDIIKKDRLPIEDNFLFRTYNDLFGQYILRTKSGSIFVMRKHDTEFDHDEKVMFVGQGPAFKKSFYEKGSFFSIVDIYLLMCSILELKPNGLCDVKSSEIENMLVLSYRKYIPRNFSFSIYFGL